jgi:hypothetical protein
MNIFRHVLSGVQTHAVLQGLDSCALSVNISDSNFVEIIDEAAIQNEEIGSLFDYRISDYDQGVYPLNIRNTEYTTP